LGAERYFDFMNQHQPPLRILLVEDPEKNTVDFRQICKHSDIPVEIRDVVSSDKSVEHILAHPNTYDLLVCDYDTARKKIGKSLKAAEAANRAKSEFLANVSHEIRTPMNAVIGMIDLALDTELTLQQKDLLQTAKISSNLLLGLLNDILDLVGIESGRIRTEYEDIDFHRFLDDISQFFSVKARQKGLEFHTRFNPDIPDTLYTDVRRLRQILANLLDNAVKFTPTGEIRLSVETSGEELLFTVSDTGIGIAPGDIKRIFDAFTQADSSDTRRFGGAGLGTAICKKLTQMLGGRIWLKSELGKGSSFYFTIKGQTSENSESSPVISPLKILLAEDNILNRKLLTAILDLKGHCVRAVENGKAAVKAFEHEPFDLILMDIQMPEMDGIEATRLIREKEKKIGGHIPIVAVTAYGMTGDRERFLALGMDDYLTKPIRRERVLSLIEELTASASQKACEISQVRTGYDPNVFNADEFLAMVGGSQKLASELIRIYLETLPEIMTRIRESICKQDSRELLFSSHSLKGMSLNLAAGAVSKRSLELEKMGRCNELGNAADSYNFLKQESEELKAALNSFLNKND
jgi:signal transduction histidine kinase/DNA-binding response OmpR family regulator